MGRLIPSELSGNTTHQLHKSLIERVEARIDTVHFIPVSVSVRRGQ